MNKPTVYIETTVVSYLTARPAHDIVLRAQQRQTRIWWDQQHDDFELLGSELVVREASAGDKIAAAKRLKVISTLRLLGVSAGAIALAATIIRELSLPPRAQPDALHVAIAAMNGVQYLLTWNCRHLTNAVLRPRIESVCRDSGHEPPVICAPPDLMEAAP